MNRIKSIRNSNFFLLFVNKIIIELQQITDQIDLPLYDLLVTGNTQSPVNLNEKDVSPIEILDFESICESNVTSSYSPTTSENLSGIQDDVFMENIPINNANNFDHDYPMDSSTQSSGQSSPHEFFNEHSNSTTYNMSYNNESFTINEEVQQPNNFFNNEATKDNIQFFGAFNSDANDSISQDFDNFSDADDKTSSSCSYISDEPAKKSSKLRGVTKKRSARNPEEKKSRKKEQNKNAATRYRKKKKEEIHVIVGEERQLMDRNRKLVTTYKVNIYKKRLKISNPIF
jgi:hypothetical protein